MDSEQNLELKLIGLQLSEDMWKKKLEEQNRQLQEWTKRLDYLEEDLEERQQKIALRQPLCMKSVEGSMVRNDSENATGLKTDTDSKVTRRASSKSKGRKKRSLK